MEEEDRNREEKSKSQVKREMLALQAMGKQLLELTPSQVGKIEMPPELREAILFAGTLKKNEARRRQLQFIGALMREADPEPIRKALDEIRRGHGLENRLFRKLEQWRDGLVNGDDGLIEEIVGEYPAAERQRLRLLASNARRERDSGKPPKSSRALFRYLKEISHT